MTTPRDASPSALERLYPGMRRRDSVGRAELETSVRAKAADSVAVKTAFFEVETDAIIAMAQALAACFRQGGRLLTMGNGGSASDAAHVAVEFNHPVTVGRPALPAQHLGADVQFVTALGNDVGFDQIFARQVAALGRAGDALIGFSTSGNSKNLLSAFEAGHRQGLTTLAFLGGDGGHCKTKVDHAVVVPTDSIHRVQECHVAAYHILWDLVHTLLAQDRSIA